MRWQGLGLSLFMGAHFMGALAGTAAADTHFPPRGTIEVSVYPCLFAKAVLPGSSGDTQGGTGIPGIGLGDPPAGPGLGPPPFGSAADPAPVVISYPDVPPADEAVYRDRIERAITFWNMNGRSDARLFEMDLRWTDWAPIPITWDAAANPPFPNDRSIEANACLQAHTEAGDLKRGGIKLLLFHPWHDTYGAGNGIAVFGTTNNGAETLGPGAAGINLQTGTVAHEIGHTLLLGHSSAFMANPPANTYPYEYGDAYDVMGRNRVDLSAYHKDRLGLMPYQRVRTLYGSENMVYRLADPTTAANGLHALRIPIDPHDTSRYLLVEYASKYRNVARTDIEAPRLYIYEIGHPDQVISDWSDDPVPRSNMRSMLLFQTRTGLRSFVTPIQSYNHDGVRIDLVMIDGDQAVIRVRSSYAQRCVAGYVWRDARARDTDRICVTPARRAEVAEEDNLAAGRTNADGSCKGGFYPRNPRADDRTCVPPSAATKARREDAQSWVHRLSSEVRGPNACKDGYTARLATDNDWVCVTRDRRRAVMEENRLADSRTDRSGEFPTCKQGFTARLATLFDRTCVPPDARDKAARENRDARSHMRFPPS